MTTEPKFEGSYFDEAYGPNYQLRNPDYKWESFLKVIRKHAASGRLLDVGCAYGLFLSNALPFFQCTGVDISVHAVQKARSRLPSQVDLFVAEAGAIHAGSHFDIITCFDILEHTSDLDVVLDNLWDLLVEDGLLVFTVPVYDGPIGWLVNLLDKDQTHNYRCPRAFWLNKIKNKFTLLEYTGIWRYFLLNRYYINQLSSSTRRITPAIMIVAKKESRK